MTKRKAMHDPFAVLVFPDFMHAGKEVLVGEPEIVQLFTKDRLKFGVPLFYGEPGRMSEQPPSPAAQNDESNAEGGLLHPSFWPIRMGRTLRISNARSSATSRTRSVSGT